MHLKSSLAEWSCFYKLYGLSLKRLEQNNQIKIHLYEHSDSRSAGRQWAGTMFFTLQHPRTIRKGAWPLIKRKHFWFEFTACRSEYFQSVNQKTLKIKSLLWKSPGEKWSIIGSEFERNSDLWIATWKKKKLKKIDLDLTLEV